MAVIIHYIALYIKLTEDKLRLKNLKLKAKLIDFDAAIIILTILQNNIILIDCKFMTSSLL